MKPLYKWSGGKRNEIKLFKDFYPDNFSTYVEPFFGAGAVFFDLNFDRNVINDIHPESINFLNEIKLGNGKEIHSLMSKFNNDEETYYFVRDKFVPSNNTEKAFVFFYLRKTCFRGMLRYNSSGKFNIPFGRYKGFSYDELLDEEYHEILSKTEIYNKDYKEIFETYNSEDNFFFLDPPYDSPFTDYGYCKFDRENQIELSDVFKRTRNKCLMIISETDFIRELYDGYIVGAYDKKYAFKIYDGRVGDEIDKQHLIIANYEIKNK